MQVGVSQHCMSHVNPCTFWQTAAPWTNNNASLQRRFLLEALQSLQRSLLALESDLHFALNTPQQELPALVHHLAEQVSHIDLYHYLQIGRQCIEEEDAVADAFKNACGQLGIASQIHQSWGHTMYHPQDALAALSARVSEGRPLAAQPSLVHHDVAAFNRDQQLFRDVPNVMTSFRKVSRRSLFSHATTFQTQVPSGNVRRHTA